MSNKSIRVQFRISGEVADKVQEHSKERGISENESAKELLTLHCIEDKSVEVTTLKSSIRILTILQRLIATQLSAEETNELLAKAHGDEIEILKNLGVDNGN
ncbi:TPA: hypothetical protein ACVO4S_001792 [Vibrio diabolicus]